MKGAAFGICLDVHNHRPAEIAPRRPTRRLRGRDARRTRAIGRLRAGASASGQERCGPLLHVGAVAQKAASVKCHAAVAASVSSAMIGGQQDDMSPSALQAPTCRSGSGRRAIAVPPLGQAHAAATGASAPVAPAQPGLSCAGLPVLVSGPFPARMPTQSRSCGAPAGTTQPQTGEYACPGRMSASRR